MKTARSALVSGVGGRKQHSSMTFDGKVSSLTNKFTDAFQPLKKPKQEKSRQAEVVSCVDHGLQKGST